MDKKQEQKFSHTLDAWLGNLSKTGRSRKQAVSVFVDSSIVIASLWLAYSLRLGVPFSNLKSTWHFFVILPAATVIIFMSLGIYRWVIRSSNRGLFKQLTKAVVLSSIFFVLFAFFVPGDYVMPRSLFIIYGLLLAFGTCGARFAWQGIFDSGGSGEPVAIYGAGDAGRQLLHSLALGKEFRPVLFLDDNIGLSGSTISGVPVCSADVKDLRALLAAMEVERVILAMPNLAAAQYKEKIDVFKSIDLPVLTVPTHAELVSGSAKLGQVRDISVTDILNRNEVPPNRELLGRCITGKNVLVTGGGGSIGSELSRQILMLQPRKIIVFDQSEFNLYQITESLSRKLKSLDSVDTQFIPILGSVNDGELVSQVIEKEQVNTVYHAAAYKHVPVVEAQPGQGLRTNVLGTLSVLDAAIKGKVDNFVFISTDKAVRPTNAMGASKRIAELVLQAKALDQNDTKISMVRFGNVLGSSGSVVPKFKKQIDSGGPITLTDANVTRFFMTIPEAAQLVMQASAIAEGGDVFVLDMGEPVRILDLAKTMVRLSGRRLKSETGRDGDIDIHIEGLRPGEKMYEELFITDSHKPTIVHKVFTASEDYLAWDELVEELDYLSELHKGGKTQELRQRLLDIAFLRVGSPLKHGAPKEDFQKPIHNEPVRIAASEKIVELSID